MFVCVVSGCGAGSPSGGATEGADAATAAEVPTSGSGGETTGMMMPGGGSSGGSSTSSTQGSTLIIPSDVGAEECDVWEQDCPAGEKCAPYANDGGSSANDYTCVPVVEEPRQVGESCTVVGGGASGVDDCVLGALCWDLDVEGNGTCVALCFGSADAPACSLGIVCAVTAEGVVNLCLPGCDPLAQDCAMAGKICLPTDHGFLCFVDASGNEGQVNDPCMYANACDAGLYCIGSGNAIECDQQEDGCCQPFCDVTLANMCAGAGQECVAWWEEGTAPPGYEKVGICAVLP